MSNANYRAGARLERLWMAQKQRAGYNVMRSAGSHGKIDCIAWNDKEIILAQLKKNKQAYSKKDIEALSAMPRPTNARVLLVIRDVTHNHDWDEREC